MIQRSDLARELGRQGAADWVIVERDQLVGHAESAVRRTEQRRRFQLTVHRDTPTGRGSAHIELDAADGDPGTAVRQALALAGASIGQAWVTRPPAAPARVKLEDTTLAAREPLAIAAELARVGTSARVLRESVAVLARQGLHTEWNATRLRVDAIVVAGGRSIEIRREARRLADLRVDAALAAARDDLELLARATAPAPGPCAVVLRADAMLHDGLGVWAALVAQADAVIERQGLTRYREGSPIADGAPDIAEPLTVASNGALDFGLASAPLGDEGDAVRRFPLVERGVAAGLGLSPREAALRKRDPNGGVRNLIVEPGTWTGAVAGRADRVIELRRLRGLSIDPYTGDASLEIGVGIDHGNAGSPFAGGSLRLDMIAALARALRSQTRLERGAYAGPDAVLIDGAELIA